jgi:hypothetical protein
MLGRVLTEIDMARHRLNQGAKTDLFSTLNEN